MALDRTTISAIPHSQDTSTAIDVVIERPSTALFSEAIDPGRLLGYYNTTTGQIELYISDHNGLRWLPVALKG